MSTGENIWQLDNVAVGSCRGYQRFFSRVRRLRRDASGQAVGRHIFGPRPKLRVTILDRNPGKRAWKASGTQGSFVHAQETSLNYTRIIIWLLIAQGSLKVIFESCFKKSFTLFENTRSVHAEHCWRTVSRPQYSLENGCLVIRTEVATTRS